MSGVSRRSVLAAAGASVVVAGCGGDDEAARERRARTAADLEIVRFLLEVDHVAAEFWTEVVERNALDELDLTTLARSMAVNERTHVETLERFERRLGDDTNATRAAVDFTEVFAAGPTEVLRSGAELANVTAAAYLGQLNRIQDRNILASVLAIHSVEGRQAAAVNTAAESDDVFPGGAFAAPLSMRQVRARLRRFAS